MEVKYNFYEKIFSVVQNVIKIVSGKYKFK